MTISRDIAITLIAGWATTIAVAGDDAPSATPYRPTVSTPANLSEPGWVELEAGGQRSKGGDSAHRDSLPYSLKYAFSPDWGVRLGGDAWVRDVASDGARLSGIGDTAIIVKRRFALNTDSAFGIEGGVNLPTAKDNLGISKTDYLLNGIYSANFGTYHTDLNLGTTRVGKIDSGESRWQANWAASLSRALNDQWGVAGEFSGTYRKGTSSTSQFLTAVSYNYTKAIVFDGGVAFGINRASPDWSLFAGVTWLLGKVP